MPYTLRDVGQQPLTPEELYRLVYDPRGRPRGPITRVGRGVVLGYDPLRLSENLRDHPSAREAGVTVYGAPDDPSTMGVVAWLHEQGVPTTLVDTAQRPLAPAELWALLELPGQNVRVPYTLVDDAVVLGHDRARLTAVLAERGYPLRHPAS